MCGAGGGVVGVVLVQVLGQVLRVRVRGWVWAHTGEMLLLPPPPPLLRSIPRGPMSLRARLAPPAAALPARHALPASRVAGGRST